MPVLILVSEPTQASSHVQQEEAARAGAAWGAVVAETRAYRTVVLPGPKPSLWQAWPLIFTPIANSGKRPHWPVIFESQISKKCYHPLSSSLSIT